MKGRVCVKIHWIIVLVREGSEAYSTCCSAVCRSFCSRQSDYINTQNLCPRVDFNIQTALLYKPFPSLPHSAPSFLIKELWIMCSLPRHLTDAPLCLGNCDRVCEHDIKCETGSSLSFSWQAESLWNHSSCFSPIHLLLVQPQHVHLAAQTRSVRHQEGVQLCKDTPDKETYLSQGCIP